MPLVSREEILRINRSKSAINGRTYTSADNIRYIGQPNGLLLEIRSTKETVSISIDGKYKEFTYDSDGNLEKIEEWTDSSKRTKTLQKDFIYVDGNLSTITSTTGNEVSVKTFEYDTDDNLTKINITT